MTPLLKKSSLDKRDPANYCPVSNLPFLSKITEQAVSRLLHVFLDKTSALNSFPSGFRLGFGTQTALVALVDYLWLHLDKVGSALLILLDHQKLLTQLIIYNFLRRVTVDSTGLTTL